MMLVVELAEDQLMVRPIHRLLRGVTGDFRVKLNFVGEVAPAGANNPEGVRNLLAEMDRTGSMGLVDGPGLALLRPRLTSSSRYLESLAEPLRDVDAARFDAHARADDPASCPLPDTNSAPTRSTVAAMVAKGAADVAVLLRASPWIRSNGGGRRRRACLRRRRSSPRTPYRPRVPLPRLRLGRRQVDFGAGGRQVRQASSPAASACPVVIVRRSRPATSLQAGRW